MLHRVIFDIIDFFIVFLIAIKEHSLVQEWKMMALSILMALQLISVH